MQDTNSTDIEKQEIREQARVTLVLVALVALTVSSVVLGLWAGPGVAAGNTQTPTATPTAAPSTPTPALDDVAPYYAENDTTIDNESYFEGRENATLENTTGMLVRVGPIVFGSGPAQGGVGDAGILLTGLFVGGIALGTVFGSGVGVVGGAVLGVTTIGGLASAAVLPTWFWPITLFGLGTVLSIVVIRSIR